MKFEWDPKKAAINLHKHAVSFEEAMTAFEDLDAFITVDELHSNDMEKRHWLIGCVDSGLLITVVFTERCGTTRLISARPASRRERKLYEAYQRISLS
ncbi:MAG TPA: BrnT family toxin [bacterium]|nr:BrnT family toxin [bacterium]